MIVLENGDLIEGDATSASEVDFTIHGLDNNALKQLADGQLANSKGTIFTADSTDVVSSIILVNTGAAHNHVNLYLKPSGGTSRRLIAKDLQLESGYSLHFDGAKMMVMDAAGGIQYGQNVSDVAYAESWDGETKVAPSKNAVYDEIELRAPKANPVFTGVVEAPAVKITTGAGANKVLTSDADGDATWETPASGVSNIQQLIDNLSIAATVGSKALTIALKGADGNNCSASNVATIAFRSATLTDGKPVFRTVTGALSVVLASGGTLGFTAAEAGRMYVWAIDNAGTVELALSRTAGIFPEGNLVTTVAIGAGSDLATAMYSTTQRTSLACRCIGYIEITTGATAGEWDNAPTKIQVMGPGVGRTGDVVQVVNSITVTNGSGANNMPWDDSIPQITEGQEILTAAITPTSALNRLSISCSVDELNANNTAYVVAALFRDAVADALAATAVIQAAINYPLQVALNHNMIAGTTSAITFRLRIGADGGKTVYWLADSGGRNLGGVSAVRIVIKEEMA